MHTWTPCPAPATRWSSDAGINGQLEAFAVAALAQRVLECTGISNRKRDGGGETWTYERR